MEKEQRQLLKRYVDRGSFEPFERIVRGKTLRPEQIAGVMFGLLWKKCVISADTGYGKTIMASALINMVVTHGKAIFVLKRFTLDEILNKISESVREDLAVGFITDQYEIVNKMVNHKMANNYNVLIISSDAVANPVVNKYLYDIREEIQIVFVDESHLFANFESVESRLMAKLIECSEYSYFLSATPFERDIQQLIDCCYYLNHKIYGGLTPRTFGNRFKTYNNGKFVGYHDIETLRKVLAPMIFILTRKDCIKCSIYRVAAKQQWKALRENEARRLIKLDHTGEPFYKLLELVNDYTSQGKKGIIYANFNDVKRMLYQKLTENGYRVGVIDGTVSKELSLDRGITSAMFNTGEYQLLISNRSVSLDQECDFVIFYEITQQYLQVIGRAKRTFDDREVIVDIIVAKGTYDEQFFMENAYPKITMISAILEKDITSLKRAVEGG